MKAEKIIIKTEPINIEIGKITLLSIKEYREAEKNIECVNNNWWLRSPGTYDGDAAFVDGEDGDVGEDGDDVLEEFGVRPALNISNLQSLNLKVGNKIKLADHNWTVISDELALCDEIIGGSAFREDWEEDDANEYEQSDIKKWLENWARENGVGGDAE